MRSFSRTFTDEILAVVRQIPNGETRSYKEVAKRAGRPGTARAVGNIMAGNTDSNVPCHRVIKSDGTLGGYNGLKGEKERLLKVEQKPSPSENKRQGFCGGIKSLR